jgi:hypothetical protein
MRKEWIGIVCLLCMLGCGVRKQRESLVRESGSTELLREDSLRMVHWASGRMKRGLKVSHIEFTAPDSMKKQFVRSVTLVTAGEEATGDAVTSLEAASKTEALAETEMEAVLSERKETEPKGRPVFWLALAGIAAGLALFATGKRIRRYGSPPSG